jgi:flagellar assembly protein FliH
MIPGQRIVSDAVLASRPVVVFPGGAPKPRTLTPRERALQSEARAGGRAEGFREGQQQGAAEGRRAATAEFAQAREALAAGMQALADERRRILADERDAVLRLALAVARKVLHAEVLLCADAAARVVEAAVASAQDATVIRIRVHPDDAERIRAGQGTSFPYELVPDPAISPGGCVVETDCGSIDASLESQWAAVEAAMLEAAASEPTTDAPAPDEPAQG